MIKKLHVKLNLCATKRDHLLSLSRFITAVLNFNNENANYHEHLFMKTLDDAEYLLSVLLTNYWCHLDILDTFNQISYGSRPRAGEANSAPERVGNAWDSFTASCCHFYNFDLASVCRIFISTIGYASHERNSRSWNNMTQIKVIQELLFELYAHQTDNGDQVHPKDVTIITLDAWLKATTWDWYLFWYENLPVYLARVP